MGEVELNVTDDGLVIRSIIYFYGDAVTSALAQQIASDIQFHWNEPQASVIIHKKPLLVRFEITGIAAPSLDPEKVWYNDDPKLNYFRIEKFALGNISFVDGIGCNSGYFKLDNLLQTSTTAAHEYGHTIGLEHPKILDIRGGLTPGIMYPRGTFCDPHLQYDPTARAGEYGGFLDPKFRKVTVHDIADLHLQKLDFNDQGFAQLGEFTSMFHEKHSE
jgi:hypothetical protein